MISEDRFCLLFENSLDAMVLADDHGRYLDVNQAACDLFGYTREQMLAMGVSDLMTLPQDPDAAEQYQVYLQMGRQRGEFSFLRSDGAKRIAAYSACRLAPGQHLSILHDITESRRVETQQGFLAGATNLLTSSLEYQTTLQSVAQLVVPHLADWCVMHLLNEEGVLEIVAAMHIDPAKVEAARESARRYPPRKDDLGGLAAVARTGISEWLEEITDEALRSTAQDEDHYRMLCESGMQSYLCAPLIARGKILGTLTFVGAKASHRYTADSLPLAEELARRAAIAVDNARLYQEAQREIEERKQAEREIAALNARLRRSMQETHHRVKNNLQIISALVELQVEEAQATVPVAAMVRISHHTRSLAAIHELLTTEAMADAETDVIATRAALDRLVPLLEATTGGRPIHYQVEDFRLPVRESASLALLVSELVSNAIKHGRSVVELSLTVCQNRARLEVCDDGPGFPTDFEWRKAANTGLGLIDSTGRHDLSGTITFENRLEGGARVVVTFPVPPS